MEFLAPGILAGLLALGLPVYLHLLRQHKTVPRPFSSLMFFERRVQSSVRHRRLKYRLLFALRALFIAFLIFAFARPAIQSARIASAHGGRMMALLIDTSFSMRQGERMARAKAAALEVARGMRTADRAQVILFGGPTRVLTNLTNDRASILPAIENVEAGDGVSSYAEVARVVRSLTQSAHGPVEAHLFSDMQKTSAPANFADLRLPEGTRLIPHAVASDAIPNVAVESVTAPRRLFLAKSGRVQATVVNYSEKPVNEKVSLTVDDRVVEAKPVEVLPFGRAAVEFTGVDTPYGLTRGKVSIGAGDRFPEDDHFYFAIERSDPAPALFVRQGSDTRSALYFATALEAANQPAFTLTQASYAQAASLDLARFAFVVLSDPSDLTRGFGDAIGRYEQHGGSVLMLLGRGSAARRSARDAGFSTVATLDTTHPALRFPANWDSVRIYRGASLPGNDGRVLLRLDDNTPLLIEQAKGTGRVMTFASGLDNIDNDLPARPLFVPFIQKLTEYLGRVETATGTYIAGASYDLRPEVSGEARDRSPIEVTGPRGERVLSLSESTTTSSLVLEHEGFYDIRRQNGRHELAAVNPDRRESDFSLLPADTLELWRNTGNAPAAEGTGANEPGKRKDELWWWVLLAALALAVAESVLGNRHLEMKEGTP